MNIEIAPHSKSKFPYRALIPSQKHSWFGYYDKSPWDFSGRYLLAMTVDFADRQPEPNDAITLGYVDLLSGKFEPFAETKAWCWQTGCMLQWVPGTNGRTVIYNIRDGNRFGSVVHNLDTGQKKMLPLPIFCITPDGTTALSLNFSRLANLRPGYGYVGVPDPYESQNTPENDGIWRMDIATGKYELIISIAEIAKIEPVDDMYGVPHWVNHIQLNPSGRRFGFLHRFRKRNTTGIITRLFTASIDGTDIYLLNPNRMNSHYDWRDDEHLLIWARVPGSTIENPVHRFILFRDRTKQFWIVGEGILTADGHCSYSPDRKWILTDTYPDKNNLQSLLLFDPENEKLIELGRFFSPPVFRGEIRCDLHPRWSRDGKAICFDSTMDGMRRVYVMEIERK
jgi:hypothetical protein